MAELPGKPSLISEIFGRAAVYDFVLAPLAIIGSAVAAYDFAWNHRPVRAWIVGTAGALVTAAGIAKATVSYFQQRKTRNIHELEGCLHTLQAALLTGTKIEDPAPRLRLSIHKPIDGGQKLQQIIDYVGDRRGRDGGAGRKFLAQCGTIGEALRKRKPIIGVRQSQDYEGYIEELINAGYTDADARKTDPLVFASMAIPLIETDGNERIVRGVVYVDSVLPEFFTPEREEIAKAACTGIARFIQQRYS